MIGAATGVNFQNTDIPLPWSDKRTGGLDISPHGRLTALH